MNTLELSLVIWLGSLLAGFLGSLTGLGGGVVVTPLLTLVFGIDIRYAIGAALVSVIATSSGAAAAYVREGFTNMRIGMFLEIATTLGALAGAYAATHMPISWIAVIFGVVLLYSAYASVRAGARRDEIRAPDPVALRLKFDSQYPGDNGPQSYHVGNVPGGFALMFIAGNLSGMLGIGAGAMKVIAMDQVMCVPFKVSTTTSNFMIGVTAAAGAGVYLQRGYIDPGLAMPVMLGVLMGSLLGARLLPKARTASLRWVFATVVAVLAIEMMYHGVTGKL